MRTSYEYNKELMQRIVMYYNGGNFLVWKNEARNKLSELLGMNKFEATVPDFEIEYEEKHENFTELRFSFNTEKEFRCVVHYVLLRTRLTLSELAVCIR